MGNRLQTRMAELKANSSCSSHGWVTSEDNAACMTLPYFLPHTMLTINCQNENQNLGKVMV